MLSASQILKQGCSSKLPLLIAVLFVAAFAAVIYAGASPENRNGGDSPEEQKQASAAAARSMKEQAARASLDHEKLLANEKRRREQEEDQESEEAPSSDELRQKGLALREEARQAFEYADELDGKKEPGLSEDYDKYLEKTEGRTLEEPKQESELAQRRRESFEQALRAPSRLNLGEGAPLPGSAAAQESQSVPALRQKPNMTTEELREKRGYRTMADYEILRRDGDDELRSPMKGLKTPWCLRQGSVIPAVLLTGINSDLPGQVSAQVASDVLDSVYGRDVVIPRGTRIVGQYGSKPGNGEERVFIAFTRLLFPDGHSLSLGAMPGQSADGAAGFEAGVDTHFMRLLSGTLLLSSISAAVSTADSERTASGEITYGSAFAGAASQSLGASLGRIIERHTNLSPTLTVEPGYAFSIAVTADIYFGGPYGTPGFARDTSS
jgi:type IV secretory pathway VirB10-like protein